MLQPPLLPFLHPHQMYTQSTPSSTIHSTIAHTARTQMYRKIGVVFCYNRPSSLFKMYTQSTPSSTIHSTVAHTAHTQMYRKMGVVFCYNRPSSLFYIPISRDEQGAMSAGSPVPITRCANFSCVDFCGHLARSTPFCPPLPGAQSCPVLICVVVLLLHEHRCCHRALNSRALCKVLDLLKRM